MTPEELTEARETIGSDCQESDLVCAIQEAGQSLLAHIDQQAKQIEALKEKLVEERAWWIFATSPDGLNDDFLRRFRMESEGDFDLSWKNDARHQLKADPDLMGVEWE